MTGPSNNLAARIEQYFRANPLEELSVADMAVKFGRSEATVHGALDELRRRGFGLQRVSVYRMKAKP